MTIPSSGREPPRAESCPPQPDLDERLLAMCRRHLLDGATSERDMRRTARLLAILTQLQEWCS